MPQVYALNHNYATFQVEQSSLLDTSYTLYDRQTVERLFKKNPKLMPRMSDETAKKIREGKLKKWDEQKLQSAIIQSVLQGDEIENVAKRFREVAEMNYHASIRNARTSITSAQNGGRMDAYHRAEDMGIHQKKQWLATLDDRTRHEHAELDGQRRELDEPFEAGGYEIMFPGDPSADPEMVYNCRCTMITTFDGFDKQVSDFDLSKNEKLGDMSYDEWKKEHEKEEPAEKHEVVEGKDISDTWVRRPDQFDFEIEDVIDAQGFDGVPRVVSADEFDRYVQESNVIMQRAYSAPDQETLKAYQDELYNGKWYVDCSSGGHMYGRGMYADGRFGTEVNDAMKVVMDGYGGSHPNGVVETFTLTPDAKILNYKNIQRERQEYGQAQLLKLLDLESTSEGERLFVFSQAGFTDTEETMKAMNWASENSSKVGEVYQKYLIPNGEVVGTIRNNTFSMDEGVLATIRGYDAINCENIDEKDKDGYFVVLNRTKCIFRKGG